MRRFLGIALLLATIFSFTSTAWAGYVHGYTRRNGTYVQGYNRSNPDNTVTNNYSYYGNVNPYTGMVGTNYYRNSPSSGYYNGFGSNDQSRFNSNSNDNSE